MAQMDGQKVGLELEETHTIISIITKEEEEQWYWLE